MRSGTISQDIESYINNLYQKYGDNIQNEEIEVKESKSATKTKKPFKFLDSYKQEDRAIFFGREEEIKELYYKVFSNRVTVLYGESGVGKTSLVQCGLLSEVSNEKANFLTLRCTENPITTIKEKLANQFKFPLNLELTTLLKKVVRQTQKTVIILFDQFEEFFLLQEEDKRKKVIR